MHELGPFLVPITLFITIGASIVLAPVARAWARRLDADAGRGQVPPELNARLERMEQAIDAIAVEVERISEGQRFTTKLLSDRATERGREAALPRGDAAGPV